MRNYHFNLYSCQENRKLTVASNHQLYLSYISYLIRNISMILFSIFQDLKLIFHQCKFYPSRKIWPALVRNLRAVWLLSLLLSWSGCRLEHFQQPVLSYQAEQSDNLLSTYMRQSSSVSDLCQISKLL